MIEFVMFVPNLASPHTIHAIYRVIRTNDAGIHIRYVLIDADFSSDGLGLLALRAVNSPSMEASSFFGSIKAKIHDVGPDSGLTLA